MRTNGIPCDVRTRLSAAVLITTVNFLWPTYAAGFMRSGLNSACCLVGKSLGQVSHPFRCYDFNSVFDFICEEIEDAMARGRDTGKSEQAAGGAVRPSSMHCISMKTLKPSREYVAL